MKPLDSSKHRELLELAASAAVLDKNASLRAYLSALEQRALQLEWPPTSVSILRGMTTEYVIRWSGEQFFVNDQDLGRMNEGNLNVLVKALPWIFWESATTA